jgi:hypothetical protein
MLSFWSLILQNVKYNVQDVPVYVVKAYRFLNPKDGTDKLSRNIGNKLPLLVA